ncbi:MAG TPA: hypothetical protein VE075_00200, partial [Thermoanaerobaculia bacterium]|nr:hypothetical protein [Thermoanaerobaculia bacterium]
MIAAAWLLVLFGAFSGFSKAAAASAPPDAPTPAIPSPASQAPAAPPPPAEAAGTSLTLSLPQAIDLALAANRALAAARLARPIAAANVAVAR